MYSSVNGEMVLNSNAAIMITDLSIQRGYGIFDFFRTEGNQPLFLTDHLDRFYNSATEMHLHPELPRDQLRDLILQLIKINNLPSSGIKIILTGGYSEDGYTLIGKSNLLIMQSALTPDPESSKEGINLITHDHLRQLPGIKTLDYIKAIYLQPFIKASNADDVLYYHNEEVTECPRANFFLVTRDNELVTPGANILKGVTRKRILAFTGFNCKETRVTLQDIRTAREAFVTSTTRIALPVLKIDGREIGNGKPGAVTREVHHKLMEQQ